MKPKVSVIITTFNRPELLREAMKSVFSQDFSNFELIVVDDASPAKEIEEVVRSFSDPRINYVKNVNNLGSAKSLNVGLKAARGEYVAILDDDDVWLSNAKIGKQVKFLDENQDCVLVGTNVVVVDAESDKEIIRTNHPFTDGELRKIIFQNNPFAHSSVMFRKKAALAAGGYDETLPRGKDYDLWLKLSKIGKISVLPDYFLKYREGSFLSGNILRQRYEDAKWTLEVMKRHRHDFPNTPFPYRRQWLRFVTFKFLLRAPFLYRTIRRVR